MTGRTRPATLILLALVAGVVAWMGESWLVSTGRPMFVAPWTMPITLVLVAVILLVLAWPVRAYTRRVRQQLERERDRDARSAADGGRGADLRDRPVPSRGGDGDGASGSGDGDARRGRGGGDRSAPRVDPLAAVRVLAFAKASSLAGSVIAGACAAVVAFVVTRPVISDALLPLALAGLAGAVVLVVAGLLAESWCTLPPGGGRADTVPSRPLLGA